MVNKHYFIINHLACRHDTKDPLSPSLHCQRSLFTQANDHDVEPLWGRSSLTTRLIHLLNPPLSSPHHRPSPRRLPPTDLVCFCPPLAVEVSIPAPSAEAALHPALPTNRGCSSAVPSPSIWWVGTLVCTAEVRRRQQDPQATLCTSRGGCNYPHVSPSNWHKHATIRGALFSCLICVLFWFDLIWFVWLISLCILIVLMDLLHESKFVDLFSC
jgi:hypothetical protein